MKRIEGMVAWALALAMASVAAAQPSGAPAPLAAGPLSREWKQLRADGFTVVGNAPPADLVRAAEDIERYREAVAAIGPAIPLAQDTPTVVVIYPDAASLKPLRPRVQFGTGNLAGAYFGAFADINYIVLSSNDTQRFGHAPAYHAYAGYLITRTFRRLPAWLLSGLSDFYGAVRRRDSDGRTVVGVSPAAHSGTLARHERIPVEQLTATDSYKTLEVDRPSRALFQASAWGLTHYLLVGRGGALRPLLADFVEAVGKGEAEGPAFARVFGPDLGLVDREVGKHLSRRRPFGDGNGERIDVPAFVLMSGRSRAAEAPVPMLEADALQRRADLLQHVGAYDDAETFVAKALAVDPGHTPAKLTRARLLVSQRRPAEALAVLDGLDGQAASSFDVRLARAEALRDADRFGDAVAAYREAAALRPGVALVHYGMSIAYLGAGQPEAASAFTRCLTLVPDANWFRTRQIDTLKIGLDASVASDAVNWERRVGWPEDETTSYMMLAKSFTERREKKTADATATLAAIAAHHQPGDWVLALVAFLRGELTADALIAKAKGDGQLTEARAYAGIIASIDGDLETARRHLEWVRVSGRKDFIEYGLALGELKRLARATATP